MDELELLLRKNELHILIIKAMHDVNKGNAPKSKLKALETLRMALETINELAEANRNKENEFRKLRLDNAIQTKKIIELNLKINKLQELKEF